MMVVPFRRWVGHPLSHLLLTFPHACCRVQMSFGVQMKGKQVLLPFLVCFWEWLVKSRSSLLWH